MSLISAVHSFYKTVSRWAPLQQTHTHSHTHNGLNTYTLHTGSTRPASAQYQSCSDDKSRNPKNIQPVGRYNVHWTQLHTLLPFISYGSCTFINPFKTHTYVFTWKAEIIQLHLQVHLDPLFLITAIELQMFCWITMLKHLIKAHLYLVNSQSTCSFL